MMPIVMPLLLVCGFATVSILLGWLFVGFHWALKNAYFGVGIGFFLVWAVAYVSSLTASSGDSLFEKIQKNLAREQSSSSALAILKMIVGLGAQITVCLAYWPTSLVNLATMQSRDLVKLSDVQMLARQSAGRQPIILAVSMLVQNLCALFLILFVPASRTSEPLRVGLMIAMLANALWLLDVALTPIEIRLRQSMSAARAFRMFAVFLLATFLAEAVLLYTFRQIFDPSASLGQATLDLVTMGQYNPAIAHLTDDLGGALSAGEWQRVIDGLSSLPIDVVFSWSICAIFGTVVVSRSVGILFSKNSFQRTQAEQISGAFTALLSNDMQSARTYIDELPKNHFLPTLYRIQQSINDLSFAEALAQVPTLVKRKRHVLELDDEVVLTQREMWFVLISYVASLDISKLWVAVLLWSAEEEYLRDRDFFHLLGTRLLTHGRNELETELHYAVALAQHQGNRSARIEWIAAKRDLVATISSAGEVTVAGEPDQLGQLMFLMATNQITIGDIVKSRAFRSMPNEWDSLVLDPLLSIDVVDLVDRMITDFDAAEPLDQFYYLTFLFGVTSSAADSETPPAEEETEIFDRAKKLVEANYVRVTTRYGDGAGSLEFIRRQFSAIQLSHVT